MLVIIMLPTAASARLGRGAGPRVRLLWLSSSAVWLTLVVVALLRTLVAVLGLGGGLWLEIARLLHRFGHRAAAPGRLGRRRGGGLEERGDELLGIGVEGGRCLFVLGFGRHSWLFRGWLLLLVRC